MPHVHQVSILYGVPNAPMIMQWTLEIFTEFKADILKYVFFWKCSISQTILGFNCTVKEDPFIRKVVYVRISKFSSRSNSYAISLWNP